MDIKNTFVIGDVHGCYYTLLNLIEKLPKDAKLVFVGDLCDKGNFSKEVIDFVIENNYACVKGNHEHLFEKYILDTVEKNIHTPWSIDKRYGGEKCIASYDGDLEIINKHLKWIEKLPTYLQIQKYFITHGFALELHKQRDDKSYYNDFLLKRYYQDTLEPVIDEDIINIFGHCVFDDVQRGDKFVCLDTGCCNGGKLSALKLGTDTIIEENMDKRDSTYSINELTLEKFDKECSLEEIRKITLKESCIYASYDTVSHDILRLIVEKFQDEGVQELIEMENRSVIFAKQLKRVLEEI